MSDVSACELQDEGVCRGGADSSRHDVHHEGDAGFGVFTRFGVGEGAWRHGVCGAVAHEVSGASSDGHGVSVENGHGAEAVPGGETCRAAAVVVAAASAWAWVGCADWACGLRGLEVAEIFTLNIED